MADYSNWKCAEIQTMLNETCATRSPKRSNTGFLDAILSEKNTSPSLFEYKQEADGKVRDIRIHFHRRPTTAEFFDVDQLCPTTPDNDLSLGNFLITPDLSTFHKINIDGEEMRQLCYDRNSLALKYIYEAFSVARRDINAKILTLLAANIGPGYDAFDSLATPVDLYDSVNDRINFNDYQKVLNETEDIGCDTAPFLIGNSDDLKALVRAVGVGCCNDAGVDLNQMNGEFLYWNDRQIESILGANYIATINPGAIQFVPYLYNIGTNEINDGQNERTTIVDPTTGMTFDITILYDPRCNQWEIQLFLNFTLVFIPDDAYKVGDPLEGVKGWLPWETTI